MTTGDNRTTALSVAAKLENDEVEAAVTPQAKVALIANLRREGRRRERCAGVTLLGGALEGLVKARSLSRAVMRNIRQNLFFAFVYNVVGVPIAAGILYPTCGWLLSPSLAAAAMALSSVSVVGNALRLRGLHL